MFTNSRYQYRIGSFSPRKNNRRSPLDGINDTSPLIKRRILACRCLREESVSIVRPRGWHFTRKSALLHLLNGGHKGQCGTSFFPLRRMLSHQQNFFKHHGVQYALMVLQLAAANGLEGLLQEWNILNGDMSFNGLENLSNFEMVHKRSRSFSVNVTGRKDDSSHYFLRKISIRS